MLQTKVVSKLVPLETYYKQTTNVDTLSSVEQPSSEGITHVGIPTSAHMQPQVSIQSNTSSNMYKPELYLLQTANTDTTPNNYTIANTDSSVSTHVYGTSDSAAQKQMNLHTYNSNNTLDGYTELVLQSSPSVPATSSFTLPQYQTLPTSATSDVPASSPGYSSFNQSNTSSGPDAPASSPRYSSFNQSNTSSGPDVPADSHGIISVNKSSLNEPNKNSVPIDNSDDQQQDINVQQANILTDRLTSSSSEFQTLINNQREVIDDEQKGTASNDVGETDRESNFEKLKAVPSIEINAVTSTEHNESRSSREETRTNNLKEESESLIKISSSEVQLGNIANVPEHYLKNESENEDENEDENHHDVYFDDTDSDNSTNKPNLDNVLDYLRLKQDQQTMPSQKSETSQQTMLPVSNQKTDTELRKNCKTNKGKKDKDNKKSRLKKTSCDSNKPSENLDDVDDDNNVVGVFNSEFDAEEHIVEHVVKRVVEADSSGTEDYDAVIEEPGTSRPQKKRKTRSSADKRREKSNKSKDKKIMYTCELCDKQFESIFNIQRHKKLCRGKKKKHRNSSVKDDKDVHKMFACEFCNKTFKQGRYIKRHNRTCHGNELIQCMKCDEKIAFKSLTKHYTSVHRKHVCLICEDIFSSHLTLIKHERTHLVGSDIGVDITCTVCDMSFTQLTKYQVHMESHIKREAFPCEFKGCGKIFNMQKQLEQHSKTHLTELVCENCGKKFKDDIKLNRHLKTHINVGSFECKKCLKKFMTQKRLQKHECIGEMDIEQNMNSEKKAYSCIYCAKQFKSPKNLSVHTKIHISDPHRCAVCNKLFKDKCNLKKHLRFVHSKERNFICDVCGKGFKQNDTLKHHVRLHEDTEPRKVSILYVYMLSQNYGFNFGGTKLFKIRWTPLFPS